MGKNDTVSPVPDAIVATVFQSLFTIEIFAF
jgi:hypothetical protein